MSDLRYPLGRWSRPNVLDPAVCRDWMEAIERLPNELRAAVAGLDDPRLDTPYRPEGWTVRQVVHHVADSHMNSYVRFRLAMTESEPTIRPYDEAAWAELDDAKRAPVTPSLDLIEGLHGRWVRLLRSFSADDLQRRFIHPEMDAPIRLDETLSLYAWHGRHHTAHITELRRREGW